MLSSPSQGRGRFELCHKREKGTHYEDLQGAALGRTAMHVNNVSGGE
jgi:hypothetical protein